jgi:ABC-type multidrug transport system fused ATPase/permease subunit
MGLSFSKNIETKFILNYVPKLLVKMEIKKYYSINYLSLCLGFFLVSAFNYIFSLFLKKEKSNGKESIYKEFDTNNFGEISWGIISFIILIINLIFYKEIKFNDIMKINSINDNKKGNRNGSFENIKRTSLNAISDSEKKTSPISKKNPEDKKDATSIFSYGKAKMISFREKNKAKKLENSLKDLENNNYEGANLIFKVLNKIMSNEIYSGKSYTNKATKSFIVFYTTLYIISTIIIFYNPIFNMISGEKNPSNDLENENEPNSKNKIWIFGFPYLLAFFIYRFKLLQLSNDIYIWNITILIFMIFEICLNLIFILFDNSYFKNSPFFFDNYYLYSFLSLILFFNILIQLCCLKVMIREIPIEKKFCSINIDNFMDIYESLIKLMTFIGMLFITKYSLLKKTIYIKYIIEILYIIGILIFIMSIFKRKQIALTKIINKITYETL